MNTSLWQLLKEKLINKLNDVHLQRRLPSVLQTTEEDKYLTNQDIIKNLKSTLDLNIKSNKTRPDH